MLLVVILLIVISCVYAIAAANSRALHQLKMPYHKFNPRYPFIIERLYTIIKLGVSNAEERFRIITALCLQYSDMVKIWFGPLLVVFVNHPQRIQKVLLSSKCADKWNLFYVLMERETALTAGRTNLKWKEHRKFFNYCFSLSALESFGKIFAECSDEFCAALEAETKGRPFDFLQIAKKFSFDVLCATSVDMKAKDLFDEVTYEKIFSGFETTEEAFNHKTEIPFLYPSTVFKLSKLRRDERKAQQTLNEFRHDIIERRRLIMKARESEDSNDDAPYNGRCVLIDHIIRNEDKFTDKEILDHVLNFIAGYEILANAIAHTILLLAIHPEIQQKLYESIQSSILSDDDVRNSAIVKDIEYLDLVVKETYRLMPTVPMILREVTDDFEIEPGLVIPKGVKLVMNFCALHRRKDIWGCDSDEFKPERFTENSESRHLFSFLPFSGGSRICIANKYSTIALKIATVQLMRRFKFSTPMTMKDIRLKSYVSLKLCTDHLISLESREK